jgi:CubicO group peptidase (beta-lactamase class C family)
MPQSFIRLTSLLLLFMSLATDRTPQPDWQGFDDVVNRAMKDWRVPGVALAVVKEGKLVYAKGYGRRDVNRGLPVTPDTLFGIGSCTKAFTAAALGMLVDEKKLEWDKPLRTYLPDLMLHDEYATAHIRPRDLLTHQSGLPRHDLVWYGSPLTRQELYDRLRYLEPSAPLHAKYQYNNLMYMTAGVLVERISGLTWEAFVRRRIFDPLGMKTAVTSIAATQQAAEFSLPYAREKDEVREIPFRNIDAVGPSGSIHSSVREMANWMLLQLNQGRAGDRQVISEASLLATQTPQIVAGGELKYDELFYSSYAMGWAVSTYRGHPMLTHGGRVDGFTSNLKLLPNAKVGVVVLTNSSSPASGVLANHALDRLLGVRPAPWAERANDDLAKASAAQAKSRAEAEAVRKKDTKPALALSAYAGRFDHPAYQTLTLAPEGAGLKGTLHGLPLRLTHFHYDQFQVAEGMLAGRSVEFLMNAAGEVDRVSIVLEPNVKAIVFTRSLRLPIPD